MSTVRQLDHATARRRAAGSATVRVRQRGVRHPGGVWTGPDVSQLDRLARTKAARIIAERQLMVAIRRAERRYEETAALGTDFDRRLERTKSALREAGYLQS